MCPRFYDLFHDDVKNSDDGGSDPAAKAAAVSGLLEKKIAAPLVRVQTALARETVLWKRGILVMPQVQLPSCRTPCARQCSDTFVWVSTTTCCHIILVTISCRIWCFLNSFSLQKTIPDIAQSNTDWCNYFARPHQPWLAWERSNLSSRQQAPANHAV